MSWKKLNDNIYEPLAGGRWVYTPSGHKPEASEWANIPTYPARRISPKAGKDWMIGVRPDAMNDVIPRGIPGNVDLPPRHGYACWDADGNWAGYLPSPEVAVECLIRWRKHKPSYVKTGKAPWHLRLMERILYGREF